MVRTNEEFRRELQYTEVLSKMPLSTVEKIGDSQPVETDELLGGVVAGQGVQVALDDDGGRFFIHDHNPRRSWRLWPFYRILCSLAPPSKSVGRGRWPNRIGGGHNQERGKDHQPCGPHGRLAIAPAREGSLVRLLRFDGMRCGAPNGSRAGSEGSNTRKELRKGRSAFRGSKLETRRVFFLNL
jgi:hypothetical protein